MEELAPTSLGNGPSEKELVTIFGEQRLLILKTHRRLFRSVIEELAEIKGLVNAIIIQKQLPHYDLQRQHGKACKRSHDQFKTRI